MHDQRSSTESEAHALLDQAVLQLMLDSERQRPWSEAEIARILSTPGHVPASLKRLRIAGLVHRWNDLATASHAAVYYHEITQSADPAAEHERHWDSAVLESLIVRGSDGHGPLTEQDLWEAFNAKDEKRRLNITDALDRLDGAGLIERRGGRSIASAVATHLSRIMTL
jgi:hypothetical protein